MADEQIVTNIVATSDFSSLIADVQRTTSALTKLQQELSLSNKTLSAQAGQIQKAFGDTLRSTGQFTSHFVTVGSEVNKFGKNLDAGKLKLRDYFGTWQQHTKTSGGLIRDLAKQQVALQNAIVQPLGKAADGMMKFNVHVANGIDTTLNKTALARKEMQIYNKVIQDGGVQLINWGKNTQWAGRQLTVGLTVPIAAFGAAAQKAFREADQELVRLTKVYGGLAATSSTELAKVRRDVSDTARELSRAYGSSYKDTIALAADIAATGKQGNELLESTREATRLSILGEVDRQEAMKATLAIQSAFKQNTTELTESINFLNAVENQTSTSLADLVEAIPKAGPVVKALGGDVQDLALYLTAMREGGINASEGANALKSALASIINPTKVAREQFMGFGIDLSGIVNKNAGDLTGTILSIQAALETLDPLKKSQAIEQLFGKFQFARMNALFENLGKQGSQTLQVLDLMKSSSQDLAGIAGRELSQITESASGQYRRAIESLKADLAGLGEQFLRISTFFIKTVDGLVKFINNLPGPLKTVITLLTGFTALAGPLIMLTGVFANFIGYVIKGIGHIRAIGRGGEGFKLLTPEILAAEKAGSLIEKTFYSDAQAAAVLKTALSNLTNELTILQQKAASGSISVQPTLSTIQGAIIAEGAQRVADPNNPLIGKPYSRQMSHLRPVAGMTVDEKALQTIFGVVPGPGPVNQRIGKNPQMYAEGDLPNIEGLTSIKGVSTGIVAQEAAKWHSMTAALAMQSKEEIALLKREVASTGAVTTELSTSYQALLPQMTNITTMAAQEAKLIVTQLQAGKVTVDQARANIIALNAQVEAMMAETAAAVATSQGRLFNGSIVPLTGQPVVDPITGKSNMKEMFHKSKTSALVDKISRSLGVRTSGGGYSTHTTIPKRLNDGGKVFYNNGDQVPGPNVNADVVPAMLTPGEFVIRRDVAQQDPDGMRALNAGQATIVPVQRNMGGMIPGYNRGGYMGSLITNAYMQLFGKNSRSNKQARLVGRWGMIMPQTINDKLAKKLNSKGASGQELIELMQEPARLIDLADFLEFNGVPGDKIDSVLSSTSSLISSRINAEKIYDDNAFGNLALNSVDEQIAALEAEYPGIGLKYQKDRLTPGRRDTEKRRRWLPEKNRNETQKEANARGGGSPTAVNVPGQRKSNYKTGRAKLFAEGNLWGHFYDRKFAANYKAFSKIFRRNAGGPIPGMQYFGSNIPGRIVQSLSKSAIERLTAGWPRPKQFYAPGYQYKLGNTDPLHGPLQIGKSENLSTYAGYDPTKYPKESIFYKDDFNRATSSPAFLVGDEKRRGMYATSRYMAGDLDIMSQMERLKTHPLGPIAAMKAVQKKFTGKLYRGIIAGKTQNALPMHIEKGILKAKETGDWSNLLGREFIVRRSSWSKDDTIADYFAMRNQDPGSIVLEAAVRNRNIVPAGDLFPKRVFRAPHGQDYPVGKFGGGIERSEQEAIFGGKFRIVGYKNGRIQIETVAEARAMGGPVNAGKPYMVGEKGPELFIPRNNGGIIPNNKMQMFGEGGQVASQLGMIGGSMGGGMLGNAVGGQVGGIIGSLAGGFLPQLLPLLKGKALQMGVKSLLSMNLAIGGTVAGLGLLYSAYKKHNEQVRLSALGYNLSEEAASKAGLKYTSLSDSLKNAVQNAKDLAEKNKLAYESLASSGTPLNMTIQQYKKLKEEVKTTMPELIKLIDITKTKDVGDLAVRLKTQFIAMGMSAQEATNKIYALISASEKSGLASGAISSNEFRAVTDTSGAAVSSMKHLNKAIERKGPDVQAQQLQATILAINAGIDEAVKKGTDYNTAVNNQFNAINAQVKTQGTLTLETITHIEKMVPELNDVLNTTDNGTSAWAKYQLMVNGVTEGLYELSGEAAIALEKANRAIMESVRASSTGEGGILSTQSKQLISYNKQIAKLEEQSKGQSVQSQINNKEEIKTINKKIDAINKEYDARKKALSLQQQTEDASIAIQKAQLEYQNALASGDMASAAQAQLNIRGIVGQRQNQLAQDALETSRQAKIQPLEDRKNALSEAEEKMANSAALAGEKLESLKKSAQGLKEYIDSMIGSQSKIKTELIKNPDYLKTEEGKNAAASLYKDMATNDPNNPNIKNLKQKYASYTPGSTGDLRTKYNSNMGIDLYNTLQGNVTYSSAAKEAITAFTKAKKVQPPVDALYPAPRPRDYNNDPYVQGYGPAPTGTPLPSPNVAPSNNIKNPKVLKPFHPTNAPQFVNPPNPSYKANNIKTPTLLNPPMPKYSNDPYAQGWGSPKLSSPVYSIPKNNTSYTPGSTSTTNKSDGSVYNATVILNGSNMSAQQTAEAVIKELQKLNAKAGRDRSR